jgi:hypothetical protein
MDISADLQDLARCPVGLVSAGVKSILDIGRYTFHEHILIFCYSICTLAELWNTLYVVCAFGLQFLRYST